LRAEDDSRLTEFVNFRVVQQESNESAFRDQPVQVVVDVGEAAEKDLGNINDQRATDSLLQ
jgi:hypothetical protein